MPKCKWCKENGDKEQMVRYEKPTTKLKKDGTFAVLNSYYHAECDILRIEDEKFKKKELKELDDLYQYLLNLHSLKNLDERMFEKIQDFRNGTIKYGNQKIKNSKEGVSYREMLDTYKHMSKNIDYALRTKPFKSKWNEFAYVFGIMVNNVNFCRNSLLLNLCSRFARKFLTPFSIVSPTYIPTVTLPNPSSSPNTAWYSIMYSATSVVFELPRKLIINTFLFL